MLGYTDKGRREEEHTEVSFGGGGTRVLGEGRFHQVRGLDKSPAHGVTESQTFVEDDIASSPGTFAG